MIKIIIRKLRTQVRHIAWLCKGVSGVWSGRLCLALLLSLSLTSSLQADEVAAPDAAPILLLRLGEQLVELDRAQFEALPQHRLQTTTAWTDGKKVFEGPLMRDVLALLGLSANNVASVTLQAWNDYEIEVSAADYYQWDVILARSMDGQALTLRDRGPLWVVYPRDDFAALQDSRFDHRWAWMLRTIIVKPL